MTFKALDPNNTLLFDIEAGGLSGYKSSVLSIAYQNLGTGAGEELKAAPSEGSWISRWSETQVWSRIKKTNNIQQEQEILSKFLNTLEKHAETPGATLAGWNIGYQALPQNPDEMRMRGFDLPMLMTRAKRYGLESRYAKALHKMQIRDVGQEWAARISEIVSKPQYEGQVDPDLYEQAKGFRKALRGAGLENAPITAQAKYMGSTGYKFAGWKQESIYQLLGHGKYEAHMAGEDVSALRKMLMSSAEIPNESEFVSHWNRLALTNKFTATARYGGKSLQEIQQFAGQAAEKYRFGEGYVSELTAKIEDLAKASGATLEDVGMGRGMPEIWSKVGKRGVASRPSASMIETIAKKVGTGIAEHKLGFSLAAGAMLLWATKPLSLFSGKDDEYNTIEGLPHGGMAEQLRRRMTEFGSGWIVPTLMVLDDVAYGYLRTPEGKRMVGDIYNTFSGSDDEHNTIEGMPHGWFGNQRKNNTAFGSGWDALRGLLREGETFAEMLAGKEFQAALKAGTQEKVLGKGAWGEVYQMTSTFRGQQFQFARKIGSIGKHELAAQKAAQETFGPTVYGFKRRPDLTDFVERSPDKSIGIGQIDMEMFHGKTLREMYRERFEQHIGKPLDPNRINFAFEDLVAERSSRASRHVQSRMSGWNVEDVNPNNVMFIPKAEGGYNIGIIDYGQWKPRAIKPREFHVLTEGTVQNPGNVATGGLIPKIQESYNDFTGMPHTSELTTEERLKHGFKSKWDMLVKKFGAEILGTSEFKLALEGATKKGVLGVGKRGEVWRMAGKFRDEEFEFARKVGKVTEHEAEMTRAFSHDFAPTVYGFKPGQMDMELFQGKTLFEHMKAQGKEIPEIEHFAEKIEQNINKQIKGYTAADVHSENVMMIPKEGGGYNVGIIDLGWWEKEGVPHPDFNTIAEGVAPNIPPVSPPKMQPSVGMTAPDRSRLQRSATAQMFENGRGNATRKAR